MSVTGTPPQSFKADRDVTFLRLLVEVAEPDPRAVSLAAERTLGRDWKGEAWQVQPLFPSDAGDDGEGLARFFQVTGAVEVDRREQTAWEISHRLRATGAFLSVRPDLPSGSYQIDEEEGFFGGEKDLPQTDPPNYTWALENISVPRAWQLSVPAGGSAMGQGIVVGHPDTGYTLHPQVGIDALDLDRDRDFVSQPEDEDALDPLERASFPLEVFPGHGTGTGSVIAGRGEGLLTGVAPKAKLIPIRAIRSVVRVLAGDVAKAIHHAVRQGAHVISMSLGGMPFPGVEAAVDDAVRKGVIVLAAAGNFTPFKMVVWPARYRNCIAVAASDAIDQPWKGSSRGGAIAITAPGTGVWVASWDLDQPQPVPAGLGRSRGTSHAVAHVAGVAALWLAHHGRDALLARYGEKLSAAFRHLARTTCRQQPWAEKNEWGPGIIDAAALLSADLPEAHELEEPAGDEEAVAAQEPLAAIPELFPPEIAAHVHQRLARLLRADSEDEALTGITQEAPGSDLERYGDELLYLIFEKREVREAIADQSDLEAPGGEPDARLRTALRQNASVSLLRQAGLV